tara:strand:- start:2315 stop:2557 length:243 start_codon:yes stop_codon:yes gene_type:complete
MEVMELNRLNMKIDNTIQKALDAGKKGYDVVDYTMYQVPSSSRQEVENSYRIKTEELIYGRKTYNDRGRSKKRSRSMAIR